MNFISKCKIARGHTNIAPDIFKTCFYEKVVIKVDIVWTSHHIAVNGLTNTLWGHCCKSVCTGGYLIKASRLVTSRV